MFEFIKLFADLNDERRPCIAIILVIGSSEPIISVLLNRAGLSWFQSDLNL